MTEPTICGYQGYEFGANYMDSICCDGYLWDADSCDEPGGPLHSGGDIPCPECNKEKWITYYMDDAEEQGYVAADDGEKREAPKFKEQAHIDAWCKGYDKRCMEDHVND
jgi:hypothetical protein